MTTGTKASDASPMGDISHQQVDRQLSISRSLPLLTDLEQSPNDRVSASSSSRLTSSDKLSALPIRSTPPLLRTPSRPARRSLEGSSSASSFDSPSLIQAVLPVPTSASGTLRRVRTPEGSTGNASPAQRVSFESDHVSLPTLQSLRQAISSRLSHHSDPNASGVAGAVSQQSQSRTRQTSRPQSPESPHHSHSRTVSPLRFFPWPSLHRARSREEPFVPVNPFQLRLFTSILHHRHHDDESGYACDCDNTAICCLPFPCMTISSDSSCGAYLAATNTFVIDTLPRLVYLHLLLRLPSLYFSRVARIFEDAEVSRPDIQRMIEACLVRGPPAGASASSAQAAPKDGDRQTTNYARGTNRSNNQHSGAPMLPPFPEDWSPPAVSPALARFKHSWEEFVDSLMKEWKTLNLVSALLLSAILTMFQIPSAATDPLIRTAALISLVCALMSLSYGCIFVIRFGGMRSMYKASRWAEEAQASKTSIWWNVWVMLAMPAVWLSWSMFSFITSILSFVWRTGATSNPAVRNALSPAAALGPRIVITLLIVLGLLYLWKIIGTFKRYSSAGIRNGEGLWKDGASVTNPAGRDRSDGRGQGTEIERERENAQRGRERQRGAANGLGLDLGLAGFIEGNGTAATIEGTGPEGDLEKGEMMEFISASGTRPGSPSV